MPGLPKAKSQNTGVQKSLEAAKHLDQMLSDLERHRGEVPGKASQGSWVEDDLELLGASAGVSAGSTLAAPGLDAVSKSNCHSRNPPTGKDQETGNKKSLEAAKLLDQMLSDLQRRREMDQKALVKAVLPGESNGSVPTPGTQREEMPGRATEDVIPETGIDAQDPARLPSIVCPQDVRRSCMIGTVVTMFTVPLVLLCCYFGIRKLYQMIRFVVFNTQMWQAHALWQQPVPGQPRELR
ncbi:uncharacterized protein M8220_017052 [Acridotheres tristis]